VDGVEVNAGWFANRIMAAAIPVKFRTSSSVAVDGTDVETRGALHGDCTTVELDGEAAETQLMEDAPKKRKAVRERAGAGHWIGRSQAIRRGPRCPSGPPLGYQTAGPRGRR
jgi:hypothetical protein